MEKWKNTEILVNENWNSRAKFEFDLEDISIWKRVKYVHLGNEKKIQSDVK